MKEESKIPDKAGLYFAKSGTCQWYNLIVRVDGEAPMLYIAYAFDLKDKTTKKDLKPYDIAAWGPEIEDPDKEKL